jgi:hypothetical protein
MNQARTQRTFSFFLFMAPHKDAHQDDYYANVGTSNVQSEDTKKPLKLKLKTIIKKDDA